MTTHRDDTSRPGAPRRRGGGFRPGEDTAGVPPPPVASGTDVVSGTGFTQAAEACGTDLDVLMGYQIFLGRDPENSHVIADAKTSPVRAFLRALAGSGEFQGSVLAPLQAGRALPHERFSASPAPEQVAWLQSFLDAGAIGQAAMRDATSWRDLIQVLLGLPGFPEHATIGAASAPAGIAAEAASRGFVLITIEQPKPGEALQPGTRITGSGWAIAPADIAEVAIYLDEHLLTHASYGLPRPDVARGFPHYRHVDHCGFTFAAEIPADAVLHPASQIVVVARSVLGDAGRKAVRVGKPAATGAGSADGAAPAWPIRVFVEDASVSGDGVLRVRGWAVCQAPLAVIEVSLGDMDLGAAEIGLARPDIAREFSNYPRAARAGFAMVRALEAWRPGASYVRVQVSDSAGRRRQAILPVTLPEPTGNATEDHDPAVGPPADGIQICCDAASLGEDGAVQLSGWVLADSGVAAVRVALDGAPIGEAATGGLRADLAQRFPARKDTAHAGFSFRRPGQGPLLLGPHDLTLSVRSRSGGEHDMTLRLTPEAGTAPAHQGDADMRLQIDRPVLDHAAAIAIVRGAVTISGWAVARGGVDHVTVLCDGAMLGRAYLGMRREDIGAAFPDFAGAHLSGFALVLPPGRLAAGTHTITVEAHANGGAARTEQVFSLTVEDQDGQGPSGGLRVSMPPAETKFGLALLSRQSAKPAFRIMVSDGAAEDLLTTLASLGRQVYPVWAAKILVGSRNAAASMAAAAAALPGWGAAKAAQVQAVLPGARREQPFQDGPDQEFVMVLRAGDELGCDALLELAIAAATDPLADLLYADDIRADRSWHGPAPRVYAKPDFSPELLLGTNFIGRAWCATATVMDRAGVTPATIATASDYDLILRLTEAARVLVHVPRVLSAGHGGADTPEREQTALTAALARRKIRAKIAPGKAAGIWRVARARRAARVSIIMPTCGARDLVRRAIATIRATTAPAMPDGGEVEIVIVDNVPAANRRLKTWLRRHADTVVDAPGAFNWSRFNNLGAVAASGDMLLFLNDDIEVPPAGPGEPGWLAALLEQAQRREVGAVGARLLYPDGKVQHAGQYLMEGHARHAFRFAEGASPGPFGLATVAREMISVTGACLMTSRRMFDRLGGFEEAHSVVNNDLDYCLRVWREGFSVIYTPHATLIHHELASRAGMADTYDEQRFAGAWRQRFLAGDPFRNPALRAEDDHYGIDTEPLGFVHVGRRGLPAASIRRILAVKLDHIGDFLTALPALRSLRQRFPQARIELLAPPASAALARQGGVVDEVIEFTFFHARSGEGQRRVSEAEFAALAAMLRARRYDMAIDLRMQPETREALHHSGAALLVGYDHDNAFPWLDVSLEWEGDLRLAPKRGHISERLVQLVSAACDACDDAAEPAPPPRLSQAAVPVLAALPKAFRKRPLVCVHPGVGNVVRQWPAQSFAGLIDLLVAERAVRVVLIGAPEEAPIADEILRAVAHPGCVESLIGRVKLSELGEVMRACVLFVGNNSGPKHLAASLGVPTVGIHSAVVDAAEWAPLGPAAFAMRRRMVCGPCYLEFASDCPRALACLTSIRPSDVFAACIRLLGAA